VALFFATYCTYIEGRKSSVYTNDEARNSHIYIYLITLRREADCTPGSFWNKYKVQYGSLVSFAVFFPSRSDITVVCKGMQFIQYPLDRHTCYLKFSSCKYQEEVKINKWMAPSLPHPSPNPSPTNSIFHLSKARIGK
jgi:hypothetical protein